MQKIHKKTWGKPLHIIFNKNIHTAITTEVQAVAELNTDIDELTSN